MSAMADMINSSPMLIRKYIERPVCAKHTEKWMNQGYVIEIIDIINRTVNLTKIWLSVPGSVAVFRKITCG
jgi:hypothetical protein